MTKTADFDYDLPKEFIAQKPAEPRDSARLMVVNRTTGSIEHKTFSDLPALLAPGDVLVLNDSRVIPARLFARKNSGGIVKILLLQRYVAATTECWEALLDGHGRLREGETLYLVQPKAVAPITIPLPYGRGSELSLLGVQTASAQVRLKKRMENGRWIVELQGEDVSAIVQKFGAAPLPPYIRRPAGGGSERDYDLARYQTVYARHDGSIAAPTAGLHFTTELIERLVPRGIRICYVTLHVGVGTFKPVTVASVDDHRMEAERYSLPEETAARVNDALSGSSRPRIVAVGTTVCRTLESAVRELESPRPGRQCRHDVSPRRGGSCAAAVAGRPECAGRDGIYAGSSATELFIRPPFEFRVVNTLITNFHLPRGTPLMLTCAFAGRELVLHAYEAAKREGYRFYSYGDAMLILTKSEIRNPKLETNSKSEIRNATPVQTPRH